VPTLLLHFTHIAPKHIFTIKKLIFTLIFFALYCSSI